MTKHKFKEGDKVKFIGHNNICSAAALDVGKVCIIIRTSPMVGYTTIKVPNCHNSFGIWSVPDYSIKPIDRQLMLFEL